MWELLQPATFLSSLYSHYTCWLTILLPVPHTLARLGARARPRQGQRQHDPRLAPGPSAARGRFFHLVCALVDISWNPRRNRFLI